MILNSLSDGNSSICPAAFQEMNGLTIVVPNEEQQGSSLDNAQPSTQTSPPLDTDFCHSDEILLQALQSPQATFARSGLEPVNPTEILNYLDLGSSESDGGAFSQLTMESSRLGPTDLRTLSQTSEHQTLPYADLLPNLLHDAAAKKPKATSKAKGGNSKSVSKRGKVTQPSKFCHVCVRSGEQVALAPCANVIGSLCRKAICQKCFDKHGIRHEWDFACENKEIIRQIHGGLRDGLPDHVWTCLHCRQSCPQSAQCKIYARTNRRRHMILKQRKAEKDRMFKRHLGKGLEMPRPNPSDILTGRQALVSDISTTSMDTAIPPHMFTISPLDITGNINNNGMTASSSASGLSQMHPFCNFPGQ